MSRLAIGIYDDLDTQTQPVLYLDPALSNMIVFGGHMSGKTTFLKTLLVHMHENMDPSLETDIFILDFGGNMGQYKGLNMVSACFDNSNEENIRRVFRTVEDRLEKNVKLLASRQFHEVYYGEDEKKPAHIMLIIDNVNSFLADDRYETYHDTLIKLCREGLSKGVSVVFTASDLSGGVSRYLGSFEYRFALEGSADKYIDIFGQKVSEPMRNSGRGVTIVNGKPREIQIFLPFMDEKKELPEFIEKTAQIKTLTQHLKGFDGDLTEDNFFEFMADIIEEDINTDDPVVGLDYYDHLPVTVNMKDIHAVAIYGKKKFGKTNLLKVLVRAIRHFHPDFRFIYFDDGRKELEDIYREDTARGKYITSLDEFTEYLDSNGYFAKMERGMVNKDFVEKDNYGTVFVMQNKMLFQANGAQLLKNVFPRMIAGAEEKGFWFIFSDVRKVSNNDRDTESSLNNSIAAAFLLDNIAEFVSDRGSRSVFGEMDPKELKNDYARCNVGDGYYYDIESDELKKIKIIKV